MFHLIDKGNGVEALYGMGGKRWTHNCTSKLVFCFSKMAMNNAYKNYKAFVMEEDANSICLSMGDAIKELAHAVCQRGENICSMRQAIQYTREIWLVFMDLRQVFFCSDAK